MEKLYPVATGHSRVFNQKTGEKKFCTAPFTFHNVKQWLGGILLRRLFLKAQQNNKSWHVKMKAFVRQLLYLKWATSAEANFDLQSIRNQCDQAFIHILIKYK